jgi:pyruvate/2-oxoglutarate dehydrogenase complex dihydrolipoamide acyltransferase (E2) component
MTRMRARIAERMMQSKNSIAMLTSFNEVNLGKVMAMRKELGEAFEKAHGVQARLHELLRARPRAEALKRHPSSTPRSTATTSSTTATATSRSRSRPRRAWSRRCCATPGA